VQSYFGDEKMLQEYIISQDSKSAQNKNARIKGMLSSTKEIF
jgi:hypothetical protein